MAGHLVLIDRTALLAALLSLGLAACGGAAATSSGTTTPSAGQGPTPGAPAQQVNRGASPAGPTAPAGAVAPVPAPVPVEGFGMTKQRAINVCMPDGERRYLAALLCPDGSAPRFSRRGNVGPRNPGSGELDMGAMDPHTVLPPGAVDTHIIDVYDVQCSDGTALEVFLDMYHCSDPDPVQQVGPLRPSAAAAPPGAAGSI